MGRSTSTLTALRRCLLFADVADADLQGLAATARGPTYGEREQIVGPDEGQNNLVIIVHGSARVYRSSAEGDEVTFHVLAAGDVYGLSLLLTPGLVTPDAAEATSRETRVVQLAGEHFLRFGVDHPQVLIRALELLGRHYAALSEQTGDLALHPARQRLAREVLRQIRAQGVLEVPASQAQLAARIGSTPGEVARGVGEWKAHGIVKSTRGRRGLLVVDIEELEAIAHEDE